MYPASFELMIISLPPHPKCWDYSGCHHTWPGYLSFKRSLKAASLKDGAVGSCRGLLGVGDPGRAAALRYLRGGGMWEHPTLKNGEAEKKQLGSTPALRRCNRMNSWQFPMQASQRSSSLNPIPQSSGPQREMTLSTGTFGNVGDIFGYLHWEWMPLASSG